MLTLSRIIVGVKYCFRYNQRNRRQQNDENGEPIDMTAMPRTHRRRREKKLMTMEEVNDRFPLTKYKAWMASRAEEGLPTAGGVAIPHSPAASVKDVDTKTSKEHETRASGDKDRPVTPSSSAPQDKSTPDKDSPESTKVPEDHNVHPPTSNEHTATKAVTPTETSQSSPQSPQSPPPQQQQSHEPQTTTPPTPTPLTRQEVQADNNMDDDDEIQIAVPTELLANPGDSCAICIDTLEDDDDVRGLTCGHAFHASCLDPWLTSRRACCPLCKADYYVPKPRPEGEAAAEGDRFAGRRPPGMSGARIDTLNPPTYAFINRREGRPRMVLPGRFMTIGHFDQNNRYGFPTVQRSQERSRRNRRRGSETASQDNSQPNTWRSRLPHLLLPRPTLPGWQRRNNNRADGAVTGLPPEDGQAARTTTPGQLEAGR